MKATKDGAVIIGELFARPVAKHSSESKENVSLEKILAPGENVFAQLGA